MITRAASSLGQALITLTRALGADVVASAETAEKRAFLHDTFGLSSDRILDCNSRYFTDAVNSLTGARGVDVVLDTLGGEHLSDLCGCMAPFGRFVNFNLEDIEANAPVRMRNLGKNFSFMTVDTNMILQKAPQRAAKLLAEVFSLLSEGSITLRTPQVFNYTNLADAFAAAQDASNTDKIVLQLDETSQGNVIPTDQHPLELSSTATYMTHDQWTTTTKPKVEGTWNLHEVMPKDLDFFIMFSSIAGIVGNPGQSNYNAGNSYQDAFCHYRRSLGLTACTIDVGGVGGFG